MAFSPGPEAVDVLVIGAGVTGIYQLYRAREAGFSVALVEAGDGVGGTWFWNRYPGARFDSESYTYAYLFSQELFDEWEWQEHFAGQPETERYLNHVVDRFDLRRHMRFGAAVTAAVVGRRLGHLDGDHRRRRPRSRARFLVAATGVLSVPYLPDVPGRDDFRGVQHHTGRWPAEPVDVAGQRVAVIGTSSSGVQVVAAVVDEVAALDVYQRSANWCTPLNNRPITAEEQARLRAEFEQLREVLNTSIHGFHHPLNTRSAFDDPPEARRAFFEEMWASPGFMKFTSNYVDILTNPEANAEWCDFIAGKIRGIVRRPGHRRAADPHRPPLRREAPALRGRLLRGLQPAPRRRWSTCATRRSCASPRPASRRPPASARPTSSCGPPASTSAPARCCAWASGAATAWPSRTTGPTARRRSSACRRTASPTSSSLAGPHAAAGNNPRYNGDQVDFVTDLLEFARKRGHDVIEVTAEAEERWTAMIDRAAAETPFGTIGQYVGGNIPGKPKRYLLNAGGRPKLFKEIARVGRHRLRRLRPLQPLTAQRGTTWRGRGRRRSV